MMYLHTEKKVDSFKELSYKLINNSNDLDGNIHFYKYDTYSVFSKINLIWCKILVSLQETITAPPDRWERGWPVRWRWMLNDSLFLDILTCCFTATLCLLVLCWHWAFSSSGGMWTGCGWACWRRRICSAIAGLRGGCLEMKKRFSCSTLGCDRNAIASHVPVDSEQTIRLEEQRTG